jgi:hypothetical protein
VRNAVTKEEQGILSLKEITEEFRDGCSITREYVEPTVLNNLQRMW